jgi:hypothetical protein
MPEWVAWHSTIRRVSFTFKNLLDSEQAWGVKLIGSSYEQQNVDCLSP